MENKDLIITRENLYSIVTISNRKARVRFNPISEDWYQHGKYLTIIKIFDKDEELQKNLTSKQYSIGNVDCLVIQENSSDEPVQVSINTESIIEINYKPGPLNG